MSWSFAVTLTDARDVYLVVERAAEEYFKSRTEEGVTEMVEQAQECAAAVESIVSTGLVGLEGPWRANLSGHANPGHKRREGWGNDSISISVMQVNPE
jgi:nicotinamide mononucleotide (NMN) deamidase PncC